MLVTTLAGQTTDTLFWASNWSGVALTYAITGGTGGGQVVAKYQGSLYPATRLSTGLYCATSAPLASCLPANLKQALFFVTTGSPFIAAYDATLLAQGPSCTATTGCNPPVIWQGPLAASCALNGDWPPLVGSDGTVYFVCTNGQVYAFDPSGASGLAKPLPTYPATPPGTFSGYGAPLLYKGSGGDVLSYAIYDSTNTVDCPVSIPVSALGPGTISIAPASACLAHGSHFNLVADAAGYLYFQNGQIAVYSPGLSTRLGTLPSMATGQSLELGSDGILYAIRGTQLAAVQIIPNHGLQTLWSIYGPGGFSYDYNSTPTLLPGPRLLSDAPNSTGAYTRSLTGETLSTSPAGLAPSPAWSTVGGDYKR